MNIENIIKNEVYCLANTLIEYYLKEHYELLMESPFLCDHDEIFQFWLISRWLSEKLEEQGETVFSIDSITYVWCRKSCGQALHLDTCFLNMKVDYTPLPLTRECIDTIEWIGHRYLYGEALSSCYVGQDLNDLDEESKALLYYALEHEGTPCLKYPSHLGSLLTEWHESNEYVSETNEYFEVCSKYEGDEE